MDAQPQFQPTPTERRDIPHERPDIPHVYPVGIAPLPIPLAALRELRHWVAWQTQLRRGKQTKVPYAPGGGWAEADNPRTWGTRDEAEARAATLPRPFREGGIGIELGEFGNLGIAIGGIDLDTCCQLGGPLEPWASEVVERFASYTETSPSGTGAKLLFTYTMGDLEKLREMRLIEKWGKAFKQRSNDGHPPAIELYLGLRYFTVTEQTLPGSTPELRRVSLDDLVWLLRDAGPAFARPQGQRERASGSAADNSRSAIAFRLGLKLRREGKTFEEMCEAVRTHPDTAAWCREKGDADGGRELRNLWDNAGKANGQDHHPDYRPESTSSKPDPDLTEDGIALAFAELHRDELRFDHHARAWYHWNGVAWRKQETALAFSWARDLCRQLSHAKGGARPTLAKAATAGAVERFAQGGSPSRRRSGTVIHGCSAHQAARSICAPASCGQQGKPTSFRS